MGGETIRRTGGGQCKGGGGREGKRGGGGVGRESERELIITSAIIIASDTVLAEKGGLRPGRL